MSDLLSLRIIDDILFETSDPVSDDDFGEELDKFMSQMGVTMYAHNGIGLAGVQVGERRRILVVDIGYLHGEEYGSQLLKIVNPKILAANEETEKDLEGCLSYPGLQENVERAKSIILEYYTPYGKRIVEEFEQLAARAIQHEMDHFDGITLFGRMSRLKKKNYSKKVKREIAKIMKKRGFDA